MRENEAEILAYAGHRLLSDLERVHAGRESSAETFELVAVDASANIRRDPAPISMPVCWSGNGSSTDG
jgi:hypothetical protein